MADEINILLKYFSDFTEEQLQRFSLLKEVYTDWNARINVISRKDIDALYTKHVLHSLAIAAVFNFKDGTEIIDIGTGGGFPGIPLAIYFPNVQFCLVDSIEKKLKVVDEVVNATGLNNVTRRHMRAEEIKDKKFDFVISRAVAPLKDLWRWTKPLLKKDNRNEYKNGLICLKGGDLAAEISESNTRPKQIAVDKIFKEEVFVEKYLLYVS